MHPTTTPVPPTIGGAYGRPTPRLVPTRMAPRVLLVDSGSPSTVHIAVGLAKARWEVHAFTAGGGNTRHIERYLTRIAAPPVDSPEFRPALDRVVAAGDFDCVVPLTEAAIHSLWTTPPAWAESIYPRLERWQLSGMADKRLQLEVAMAAGVSVPAFFAPTTRAALHDAVRALGLPLVVKGSLGEDMRIAHTEAAVVAAWETNDGTARPYLQRFIQGRTYLVGGLFHEGTPLRLYAAETTELSPPFTGQAVRLRTVYDPELVLPALTVLRVLRWSGLASVSVIRDSDGRFHFLDVCPCPWDSIGAAALAGVDLFTPFSQLLNRIVPPPDLAYTEGLDSPVFPQRLEAHAAPGTLLAAARVLGDVRTWRAAPWRRTDVVLHLARGVWRSWRNAARDRSSAPRRRPRAAPVAHTGGRTVPLAARLAGLTARPVAARVIRGARLAVIRTTLVARLADPIASIVVRLAGVRGTARWAVGAMRVAALRGTRRIALRVAQAAARLAARVAARLAAEPRAGR